MPRPDFFVNLAAEGVRALQPYVPGKPLSELEREYGLRESIKLASNENPLGPSPASLEAIRQALGEIGLYPDGGGFGLRQALASRLDVDPAAITLGNGSNDLLVLLAEAFLTPECEAVYSEYAFIVYALAVQATSARARVARAHPPDHPQPLGHDLDAMRALVGPATRLVYIANPNNPTGTWLESAALRAFIAEVPGQVIVVLDEAYREYTADDGGDETCRWIDAHPNLVVTRTFSKIHGLAGLRVGYAVSRPELAQVLNRVRQPFNVNSLGQVAAVAALGDAAHVRRSRAMNAAGLRQLDAGLKLLGWTVNPSAGNFVLADTGADAQAWYAALLERGVIVRPVANYGLPRHLRISVGTPLQNERLLGALRDLRDRLGP